MDIKEQTSHIRRTSPIVANITNGVVMNFTANALLAIGASPVMFNAADEARTVATAASSLVVNIGTLDNTQLDSIALAMRAMNRSGKPVVFDPVGAGFTPYRNRACLRILTENNVDIIKGNASEILALASRHCLDLPGMNDVETRGVDAIMRTDVALEAARLIAQKLTCIVVVSGETDIITDGHRVERIEISTPIMTKVTGMGCVATAIVAAYAAVESDNFGAATAGMTAMAVAGRKAAEESSGPGTFVAKFLDNLYLL